MFLDIESTPLTTEQVESLGNTYLQTYRSFWHLWRHRNQKVAQRLAESKLPATDEGRWLYLAKTLAHLPNLRGGKKRAD